MRLANRLGLDVALDIAFQASPDHPWVREHPEWFRHRPDGSIKYAENPPKKYQDIYPLDFESAEWEALWDALRDVFLFWIGHGVRIFRVDNPHTKAFPFWEWVIAEIRRDHPDAIFLAEAFTRPEGDAVSREGGLQAVLHLFHLAQHGAGTARVPDGADEDRAAGVHAAELLREHAGHPPRVPADRWPARVRSAADSRRDARRQLRHLQRLRAV